MWYKVALICSSHPPGPSVIFRTTIKGLDREEVAAVSISFIAIKLTQLYNN